MRILTADAPGFDPSAVLLSVPLQDARDRADRVSTTWSEEAVDGLDPQGLDVLTRALAGELPQLTADRGAALATAVADSARALATTRWREGGPQRPDTPLVDRLSVRGALLLHLHGRPDGPLGTALRQHDEEGQRLQGSPRRRRRTPAPTREQVVRHGRALRAHEEALSRLLASIEEEH